MGNLGLNHRLNLLTTLTRRDLAQRYKGATLGALWSFLSPVLLLIIYVVVFREVFAARWPSGANAHPNLSTVKLSENLDFALNLFAGLLVLNAIGEVIGRSPKVILEHAHLVRRVIFPLPVLVQVLVFSALINALINWFILAITLFIAMAYNLNYTSSGQAFESLSYLMFVQWPLSLLIIASLLPVLLGIGWLLAALGTYFRDLGQIAPALVSVLMFLGPVFYPVASLPESMQTWVMLNPLTIVAEQLRLVLLQGQLPDWRMVGSYLAAGSILAWLAYRLFIRVQHGFADVL
jgi:lipopolysaccharide transport system permease protein